MKKILATVLGVVFAMFAFAGCNMAAADGTATIRRPGCGKTAAL